MSMDTTWLPHGTNAAPSIWTRLARPAGCLLFSVAWTSLLESQDSDGLRRACAGRQPDLWTVYGPGLGRGPDSTPSHRPDSDRSGGADIL